MPAGPVLILRVHVEQGCRLPHPQPGRHQESEERDVVRVGEPHEQPELLVRQERHRLDDVTSLRENDALAGIVRAKLQPDGR